MVSTAAEACSWMTDESALLTAWTSDLQTLMMIAETHDETGNSHWMASLRATFSTWKELLWVPVGACHSWTRKSWLRTTKLALPSSIPSKTEPSVKIWKSTGGMEARVWSVLEHFRLLIKGGWVWAVSRSMSDGAKGGLMSVRLVEKTVHVSGGCC